MARCGRRWRRRDLPVARLEVRGVGGAAERTVAQARNAARASVPILAKLAAFALYLGVFAAITALVAWLGPPRREAPRFEMPHFNTYDLSQWQATQRMIELQIQQDLARQAEQLRTWQPGEPLPDPLDGLSEHARSYLPPAP